MAHNGKCAGVFSSKVMLQTGEEKKTVECGGDNWRCDSVEFVDAGCDESEARPSYNCWRLDLGASRPGVGWSSPSGERLMN